ncbi:MAG: GAF domain-containing protein [Planctomycetes bacterium]|nr:GAF domain-containing protein [Planctomycetota bacterium]
MPAEKLLEVAQKLIQAGSGQDMYRTLVTRVRRSVGRGVSASFFLVYRASDLVLPVAESTQSGRQLHPEAYTQKITTGIIGHVVKTAKLYYARDVTSDPLFISGGQVSGSEICAPVMVDGDVVGILNIEADRPEAFLPEVVARIELLCTIAGSLMNMGVAQEQLKAVEAQVRGLQEAAASSEARFATLAGTLGDLVLILDGENRIAFANGAWGGALRDAAGKDFDAYLDEASTKSWEKAGAKGGAVSLTLRLGKKSVAAEGRVTPFTGAGGAPATLVTLSPAARPAKKAKPAKKSKRRS